MLNYVQHLSSHSARTGMMTKFRLTVAYMSTEVTEQFISLERIVPHALRPVSGLFEDFRRIATGENIKCPYYVIKLVIACDLSLICRKWVDDNRVLSHWRICVISYTVAMTTMSLSYIDDSPKWLHLASCKMLHRCNHSQHQG